MIKIYKESILHKPITSLGVSGELVTACELNGFDKLADLLPLNMAELLILPGFDHRVWNEYVQFLEERKLGFYLN